METISSCRVCQSRNLVPFFDLGKHPLANSLLQRSDEKEKFYPLSLSYCPNCSLVQLNETVEPEKLFSHYVWVTVTSRAAREWAQSFYEQAVERAGAQRGYVLEVASNDGTFLKPFQSAGWEVLGVDPAQNVCDTAVANGVATRCAFFSDAEAREIVKERGRAQIVFARNVLAHVAATRDFVKGLATSLHEGGTLIIEAHYAKVIQEELHYDSIYHEHLCYFTLKSMEHLLQDFGLRMFDVAKSPISGGALMVFAKKGDATPSENVAAYREEELRAGTNDFSSWQRFAQKSFMHRGKLVALLRGAQGAGRVIVGWGASARSSTMLNFCGIGTDVVQAIIDLNPLKQGKFTAGAHIPVVPAEAGLAARPGMVFITGWNFREEIMEALKEKFAFHGECLIPLPNEPRVVEI